MRHPAKGSGQLAIKSRLGETPFRTRCVRLCSWSQTKIRSRSSLRNVGLLDDHLLGRPRFARDLFEGVRGTGQPLQGAAIVNSLLQPAQMGGVDDPSRRLTSGYKVERHALPLERT